MYHRNKVHTDEFWRYELTKNRKTVLDDVANEDAWKQQLGKHAEEAAKLKKEAAEAAAAAATEEKLSRPATPAAAGAGEQTGGSWIDQVKRSSTPAPAPAAPTLEPVTTEMKLLALQNLQQNLQSSLHFMSMGMAAPQLLTSSSSRSRWSPLVLLRTATSPSSPSLPRKRARRGRWQRTPTANRLPWVRGSPQSFQPPP